MKFKKSIWIAIRTLFQILFFDEIHNKHSQICYTKKSKNKGEF